MKKVIVLADENRVYLLPVKMVSNSQKDKKYVNLHTISLQLRGKAPTNVIIIIIIVNMNILL